MRIIADKTKNTFFTLQAELTQIFNLLFNPSLKLLDVCYYFVSKLTSTSMIGALACQGIFRIANGNESDPAGDQQAG